MLDSDQSPELADCVAEPRQASGNWHPSWEPFARLDPEWTEKVIAMAIAPTVAPVST